MKLRNRRGDDDDDDDLDLDNRWGMDEIATQRAEIEEITEEITEEDVVEEVFHDAELELSDTEDAFHGFDLEEVERALKLQAEFGTGNEMDVTEEVLESEVSVLESEVSPSRRKNISPKERRKRKAAAKARSGE